MRKLVFFKDDGIEQAPATADLQTGITTLVAGTYYAELEVSRVEKARLTGIHWAWGATLAATITVEGGNFPEVTSHSATGWKATSIPTVTIPGGSAAEEIGHWADQAMGRLRAKIVVTVAGTLRGADNHKGG